MMRVGYARVVWWLVVVVEGLGSGRAEGSSRYPTPDQGLQTFRIIIGR